MYLIRNRPVFFRPFDKVICGVKECYYHPVMLTTDRQQLFKGKILPRISSINDGQICICFVHLAVNKSSNTGQIQHGF